MNRVFKIINCRCTDELYDEAVRLFNQVEAKFYRLIEPAAQYKFCRNILNDYEYTVLILSTLGDEISGEISELFDNGRYMEGILLDTMASDYLMQMDRKICVEVGGECAKRSLGTTPPFEPAVNIPTYYQEIVINEFKDMGITVTESFMMKPLKSLSKLIGADKRLDKINICHTCGGCGLDMCKWRQ